MLDPLTVLQSGLAGRYRVDREIGAGGMATVYKAYEERHDRLVAIKVLRPALAAALGAERFLREIKITAALQHPHILPLYDSGSVDGLIYYVMPFVEGESLRDRLNRLRQLPVRDALEVARAVASALEYAHQRGLVHRDIKPENILLAGEARDGTHGLRALVADFGVAVAMESASPGRLTQTGMAIGSPGYMSPEQAGAERQLGPPSDVYALGVVLYEMLAGEPPFTGPTARAVVTRVMSEAPAPLRLRRPTVPPPIEVAVMRALEKTPADRFASAAQFAAALDAAEPARPMPGPGRAGARRSVMLGLTGALALVFAGVVLGLYLQLRRGEASPRTGAIRLAIPMPPEVAVPHWEEGIAAGDQGQTIAFAALNSEGRTQLHIKRMTEPAIALVPGSLDALNAAFSPDGQWLAFMTGAGQLKKVRLSSGSATVIADSLDLRRMSGPGWAGDGTILIGGNGIWRVSENGGVPALAWPVDTAKGDRVYFGPQRLPNGSLMYTARGSDPNGPFQRLMVRPAGGGTPRVLLDGVSGARYLDGGGLVYQKDTDLLIADLELKTLTVTNEQRLLNSVAPFIGIPQWALSGEVLVYRGAAAAMRSLSWVHRDGRVEPLGTEPRLYQGLSLSPDGRRAAVGVSAQPRNDLWIYDIAQDILTKASFDGETEGVLWTPDGRQVTTVRRRGGEYSILNLSADGAGASELLARAGGWMFPASWARDARRLVVMGAAGIGMIEVGSDRSILPIVPAAGVPLGGRVSPDQRWLAYVGAGTGRHELYVTPFPGGGTVWRVSRGGAREAVWSPDGKELIFRSEDGRQMLSAAVRSSSTFAAATPRLLFETDPAFGPPGLPNYDITADGKRFLMLLSTQAEARYLNVIQRWRELIPASRPR